MRRSSSLAFVLALAAACTGGTSDPDPIDPVPDANVEDLPPPARGFQIVSKDVTLQPGEETTYCYYFRTSNTESLAINKWKSVMTAGSHHMIMFTTGATDLMPPGTVSATNCGFGMSAQNAPVWTYSTQTAESEITLPGDDGAGNPLAQVIPPNTAGFLQMHYWNSTDNPLTAHVTVNAEALAANASFTRTAPFITYDGDINIAPGASTHKETTTCNTPAGAKFWLLSTHAHKQATSTRVKNGMPASDNVAFESNDWEHPGAARWMTSPFYTFAGDKMTIECTYNNPGNAYIREGDSAETDEMCMASGYFFPATAPVTCYCVPQGCYNF